MLYKIDLEVAREEGIEFQNLKWLITLKFVQKWFVLPCFPYLQQIKVHQSRLLVLLNVIDFRDVLQAGYKCVL